MLRLNGTKICVLGAKRSSCAICDLALQLGAIPKVSDKGFDGDFKTWAQQKGIVYEHGGHTQAFIQDSGLVVLSPGVSFFSPPVEWARQKKIPVLGEVEFAFQFCQKPVIAVTGSNGKTTVSTLVHLMLAEAGKKNQLCGNIGTPFAQFCLDQNVDYFVLEVSSFQLESLLDPDGQSSFNGEVHFKGFEPKIAVLLNFNDNHLDRHKNLQEYFEAKTKIFLNQTKDDFAVVTSQNDKIKAWASQLSAKVLFFDTQERKKHFATENPNHLAVCQVGEILGIPSEACLKVFREFKGVEHRLEWVRTLNGVDFFNDSKATTAEAGRWALTYFHQPVVMICGGRDKNIDFSVLRDSVRQKVKRMIVFGEAKEKIKGVFEDVVQVDSCQSMEEAVEKAKACAQRGDCVVLSPMCASFDMFTNYEERGKVFKQIVQRL
ncbi:MAG TPA: UDP-N-acetylmuramoyl-L-alanine--D-glutamate ligase [Candidatus Omnitrophota bacterium]|nr:UDP-N-acetylmuramoyl-L-alanine--D-glutamate ligase [Candidatus Omnitrophota bacterium]